MRQWKQHIVLLTGLAGLTMSAVAAPANFDRYKVILEKEPFGTTRVPAVPVKPPPPVNEEELWTKNYRLSMLQEEMDGSLLLGLVNNQTQGSIMLAEGESHPEEGIKFISGDYETGTVKVSKDGDERELGVGDNQLKTAPGPAAAATKKPTPGVNPSTSSSATSSYAARRVARQNRLADLRKQREEASQKDPALPAPLLQKHLENMQLDAIRKGAPPLPVPLTPQMEQQLINEGVIGR